MATNANGVGIRVVQCSERERGRVEERKPHSLLMFFAFPPPLEHWGRARVPFWDNEQANERAKGWGAQKCAFGSLDGAWMDRDRWGEIIDGYSECGARLH